MISKFYGTSTPKGSYSTKTGVNSTISCVLEEAHKEWLCLPTCPKQPWLYTMTLYITFILHTFKTCHLTCLGKEIICDSQSQGNYVPATQFKNGFVRYGRMLCDVRWYYLASFVHGNSIWCRHIKMWLCIYRLYSEWYPSLTAHQHKKGYSAKVSEWYQSLTAHQHQKGHTVPKQV